jgi:hypothetical protein
MGKPTPESAVILGPPDIDGVLGPKKKLKNSKKTLDFI